MWGNWSLHQSFWCERRKGGTDGINISQENLTGLCDRLGVWDEGAGWNKCYFQVDICLVGPSSLSPWASHSLCKLCPVGKFKELWFSGSACLPCPLVPFIHTSELLKGIVKLREEHWVWTWLVFHSFTCLGSLSLGFLIGEMKVSKYPHPIRSFWESGEVTSNFLWWFTRN